MKSRCRRVGDLLGVLEDILTYLTCYGGRFFLAVIPFYHTI